MGLRPASALPVSTCSRMHEKVKVISGASLQAASCGGVDIVQLRQKVHETEAELAALEIARSGRRDPTKARPWERSPLSWPDDSRPTCCISVRRTARLVARSACGAGPSSAVQRAPRQTGKAIKDRNVDYFCVGPVYATSTKPDYQPVGLDLVRYAARKAPVGSIKSKPWFAIGGISLDNIDDVIEAGHGGLQRW